MGTVSVTVMQAGTKAIGMQNWAPIAVPLGSTSVTVAIDRAGLDSMDIATVCDFGMELSLDGGKNWLSWGSMRCVGTPVLENGSPMPESFFSISLVRRLSDGSIEPGFEPTNPDRQVRGHFAPTKAVTTSMTVRFDDTAVPLQIAMPAAHHSVAWDNTAFIGAGGGTSLTTGSFTITSSANRAALMGLSMSGNSSTGFSGTVGGATAAAVSGTDSTTGNSPRSLMWGCAAPASGSQTASMSWTTSQSFLGLGVVTASGVDQTTPFNNGTFAINQGATISLAITSNSGDMTCDVVGTFNSVLSSPTQLHSWNDSISNSGGGSVGPGTAGPITHSWSSTNGDSGNPISGANFVQLATSTFVPYRSIYPTLLAQ